MIYILLSFTSFLFVFTSYIYYKTKDIDPSSIIQEFETLIENITVQTNQLQKNVEILNASVKDLGDEIIELKIRNVELSYQLSGINQLILQLTPSDNQ